MFTRAQYLAGECSHQEYYGQFVNQWILTCVKGKYGVNRLIEAEKLDINFNTIPLYSWDQLNIMSAVDQELWAAANGSRYYSLSDNLCIQKQAARMIVEKYHSEQNATV
jgi:hypothetical protein